MKNFQIIMRRTESTDYLITVEAKNINEAQDLALEIYSDADLSDLKIHHEFANDEFLSIQERKS